MNSNSINNKSYKREREDNSNNKDNNSNNNNNLINNSDDNNNYLNQIKKYKYDELTETAKSLGIKEINEKEIERVCKFIKYKDDLIQEKQYQDNINSFNKDIPTLKNTSTIEPGELLFWRVFRDKYLFKQIFSNFVFSNLFQYNQLFDVARIFKKYSNGEAIIKDKVKCGSYLMFGKQLSQATPPNGYISIYQNIVKENKENLVFYKQLFTNYSKYFIQNTYISLSVILLQSNLLAFKSYLQFLDSYSDRSNSIGSSNGNSNCINSGSSKNSNCNFNFKEFFQLIKKPLSEVTTFKALKLYYYIKENYNYLELDISLQINLFNSNFKISHLFKLIELLVKHFKVNKKYYICPSDLESIKQLFTKDQLKLNIKKIIKQLNNSNSINNDNSNNKEIDNSNNNKKLKLIINNFIKLYYSVTNNNKPLIYYILFKNINKSFYKLREFSLSDEEEINYYKHLITYSGDTITSEERYQLYEDLVRVNENFQNNKVFTKLVKQGNFKLIDMYFKIDPIGVFQSIESKNALDYLFKNFKEFYYQDKSDFWLDLSSIELLEHYENQMKSISKKLLVNSNYSLRNLSKLLEFLLRAKENPSIYEILDNELINSVLNVCISVCKSQDLLLYLFKSYSLKTINLRVNSFNYQLLKHYKVAYWLLNDNYSNSTTIISIVPDPSKQEKKIVQIIKTSKTDNSKSTTFSFKFSQLLFLYNSCGLYDEIFKLEIQDIKSSFHILYSKFCKLDYFDGILNYYFYKNNQVNSSGTVTSNINNENIVGDGGNKNDSLNFKNYLKIKLNESQQSNLGDSLLSVLHTQALFGNLKLFQLLVLNYIFLICGNDSLLVRAVETDNLHLIDLFLNFFKPNLILDPSFSSYNDSQIFMNNNGIGSSYLNSRINQITPIIK